ncbi:MAG TPA: porin [Steroidobacteraceae bacterium]|nr:porin [Steroidobacteraceae bacterium]
MAIKKVPGLPVALLASGLMIYTYAGQSAAQSAQDQSMQDRMRILQQRIDDLAQQLDAMKKEQQAQAAKAAAAPAAPAAAPSGAGAEVAKAGGKKEAAPESKFDNFMKGFFGTLDVSFDDTTKGIDQGSAFHWNYADPLNPASGLVQGGNKGPATGRVGYIPAISSNGSNIGYRGSHRIGKSDVDFIYQVSTALNIAAAPGLNNTWTKSSNVVTGAIGLGDTYIGLKNKTWGTLKVGTMFGPYKTSTDRLNPFGSGLGNYSTILGNTGGDNRVEFGTRFDHIIVYTSPTWEGLSFDVMLAPGQNVTYNNVTIPLGSSDCSGSNSPGSGNLFLNCDDGGFGDAYGGDIKFEKGGLYLTAAYEMHRSVNRNSDGIGSNSPYYNYLLLTNSPQLDFGTYNAFAAEFPGAAAATTPPYLNDIANEYAWKFGGQYRFPFGLAVDAIYEHMFRSLPAVLEFQNERERFGTWFALEQDLNDGGDVIAAGWAHAGRTPGDPAGQHNYNASFQLNGDNQANTYSLQYRHKLDKQLTWYLDGAETINDGNAHYDIGAGGHGIKTDCHDGTNTVFTDFTSAGPTTWGGCHELGFSTGMTYKF